MSDSRNATSSWSWYLHQWKVGIFVALKKIVELIDGKNDNEIEEILIKRRIIYENAEDFDIQEKDENWLYIDHVDKSKWKVDSRHQVKAYKDWNNLNDYKDVLNIQKCIAQEKKEKWKKLKKTKKTYVKIIKIKWFQIRTFYVDKTTWFCTEWNIEVDDNNRFLHTIKNVQWFWLSKKDFETKKATWEILNDPNFRPNPNNIKLYPYPDWNYCDITSSNDNIKEWCNEEIKKIKWNESIDNIYEKLLYLLDEEIRNKHAWWYPIFSFYDLYNEINAPTIFEIKNVVRLRESFSKFFIEFKEECYELWKNIITPEKEEIIINIYKSTTDEEFYTFLINIHPDRHDLLSLTDSNIDSPGFKDVFFRGIFEVLLNYDKNHLWYLYLWKKYILTTITRDSPIVSRDILENPLLSTEKFEWNFIINKCMNWELDQKINKIKKYKNKINFDTLNYSKDNINEYNLFMNPKKISFVKIDKAIKKLK